MSLFYLMPQFFYPMMSLFHLMPKVFSVASRSAPLTVYLCMLVYIWVHTDMSNSNETIEFSNLMSLILYLCYLLSLKFYFLMSILYYLLCLSIMIYRITKQNHWILFKIAFWLFFCLGCSPLRMGSQKHESKPLEI